MMAHAVMTALLDRRLLQERTRARTVSPAEQRLWGAVSAASVLRGHLQPPARPPATSVLKVMRMRTQTRRQNARCSVLPICAI